MFPLQSRKVKGYKFGEKTYYGVKHSGTDYEAKFVPYFAPFDGKAVSGYGIQGGYFWTLTRADGVSFTARHLSKILKTGVVKRGEQVAVTGNSGALTTNAHLHQEVRVNNQVVDPETFDWNPMDRKELKVKILMNNQPYWNSLLARMAELDNFFAVNSDNKLDLLITYKETNLSGWSTVYTGGGIGLMTEIIKEDWFDQNVVPLANGSDIVIFVMKSSDFAGGVNGPGREVGYCYPPKVIGQAKRPIRIFIALDENEDYPPDYSGLKGLSKFMAHEISHGLYQLCAKDSFPTGVDLTHNHFLGDNGFPIKPEAVFGDWDINKL